MRNLNENPLKSFPEKEERNNLTANPSKTVTFQINHSLLIKCQNFIVSKHLAHDYTYANLSDLIRKSLIEYKEGRLNLTAPRLLGSKKAISAVFPFELWKYYQSLPSRNKWTILEICLANYLNVI